MLVHSVLPVQKAKISPGKLPSSHLPTHTHPRTQLSYRDYHISHALGRALFSLVGLEFLQREDFIVCTTEGQEQAPASEEGLGLSLPTKGTGETLLLVKCRWLGPHCGFCHSSFPRLSLSPLAPQTNHAKRGTEAPLKSLLQASTCGGGGNYAFIVFPEPPAERWA